MNINEIVGNLKAGGLDASSTNRSAAVYVTEARSGRAEPGWFGFRIICDSEATERRVRAILSRWYDIDASGDVWRLRAKNRVPLMAIKRGGVPPEPPIPAKSPMYFEAAEANSTVSMMSLLPTAPNLEYSTDGQTWQEWEYTDTEFQPGTGIYIHVFDTITLGAVGDKVYIHGDNPNGLSQDKNFFSIFTVVNGLVNVGGNVISLIDKQENTTVIPDNGFNSLFATQGIASARIFSGITKIGDYGCDYMFGESHQLAETDDFENLKEIGDHGCADMFRETALTTALAMPVLEKVGKSGLSDIYILCENLATVADFPKLEIVGDYALVGTYTSCPLITVAANLPALQTIGEWAFGSMYFNSDNVVLLDNGNLAFDFIVLPYTDTGGTTYSQPQDVVDMMKSY